MANVVITGSDSLIINGHVISNWANNDYSKLEYDEDLVKVVASKNGNVLYAFNQGGLVGKMTLRLTLGGADDVYLTGLLNSFVQSPASFILAQGSYTKRVGNGKGKTTLKIYQLDGGVIRKIPRAKSNSQGDTDQSVVEYEMLFGQSLPAIA